MDQTKRTTNVYRDEEEPQAPSPTSTEVRTLNELELVLCGGGEVIISWPG